MGYLYVLDVNNLLGIDLWYVYRFVNRQETE